MDNNRSDNIDKGQDRQDQQRQGTVDRQQNQQKGQETLPKSNPGLEESNRIDLDEEGHRDQQA